MGIYFSIDYRSLPSGFGQIVDESQPMRISGDRWNYTLIAFKGCGQRDDPSYKKTHYIDTENWHQIITQTYHLLKQHGVTEVYDSELQCDWPGMVNSHTGKFNLDIWYQLRGE